MIIERPILKSGYEVRRKSLGVTLLRFVSHSPILLSLFRVLPFSLPKRQAHSSFIAMFPFCLLGAESEHLLRKAGRGGLEERGSSEKGGTKMAEMAFMVSYVTWMDALARQAWPISGPLKARCPHLCPDLPACVGTMI